MKQDKTKAKGTKKTTTTDDDTTGHAHTLGA
jgi:hypothetical protein